MVYFQYNHIEPSGFGRVTDRLICPRKFLKPQALFQPNFSKCNNSTKRVQQLGIPRNPLSKKKDVKKDIINYFQSLMNGSQASFVVTI